MVCCEWYCLQDAAHRHSQMEAAELGCKFLCDPPDKVSKLSSFQLQPDKVVKFAFLGFCYCEPRPPLGSRWRLRIPHWGTCKQQWAPGSSFQMPSGPFIFLGSQCLIWFLGPICWGAPVSLCSFGRPFKDLPSHCSAQRGTVNASGRCKPWARICLRVQQRRLGCWWDGRQAWSRWDTRAHPCAGQPSGGDHQQCKQSAHPLGEHWHHSWQVFSSSDKKTQHWP